MKLQIALYSIIFCFSALSGNETEELPDNYLPISLGIQDGKLVGGSEYLEGFIFSMDLPVDFLKKPFNKTELFAILRDKEISGTLVYPNNKITEIAYEIVNHRGTEGIYMKTSLGYFLWEMLEIKNGELSFAINWWYCPPAKQEDFDALLMTEQLLADSSCWHKMDDRECEDDIKKNRWSLFCAIKYSSIQAMGEYNHHNAAMQALRFAIDELIPGHGFEHTLMDFNNAPSTTHQDILYIINQAKKSIAQELEMEIDDTGTINQ